MMTLGGSGTIIEQIPTCCFSFGCSNNSDVYMKPKYTLDGTNQTIPEIFRITVNWNDIITTGWGASSPDGYSDNGDNHNWIAVEGGYNFTVYITQCGYYNFIFIPSGILYADMVPGSYAQPLF
jgi:hypothetical protein